MVTSIEKPEGAIEGQYMFLLDPAVVADDSAKSVAEALLEPHGGVLLNTFGAPLVGFAANGLDDTKALAMAKDARILGITQDFEMTIESVQSNAPWQLDRIDQPLADLDMKFHYEFDGAGVNVYVLDTGIRASHQEFGGRVKAAEGADFVNDGNGTNDCHGHGTHVASLVGGAVSGVAKGANLIPVRAVGCNGQVVGSNLLLALNWLANNHKKPAVVNMSVSAPAVAILDDLVKKLVVDKGVPVVASAGNQTAHSCGRSPGRVKEVITVGASGQDGKRPIWSNVGGCVDLYAPGVGISAASHEDDTNFVLKSGTSQAAPLVAGAVATYLSKNPTATPADVHASVTERTTKGVVTDLEGSPSKLLYSRFVEPGGHFGKAVPWDVSFSDAAGWNNHLRYDSIRYADLNGDKLDDVCGFASDGIYCALSDGIKFGPQTRWNSDINDAGGWSLDKYRFSINFVDVTGDGKADLCMRGQAGIHCGISNGTTFEDFKVWSPDFSDFNGWDGIAYGPVGFPDLNGDGKADVCVRGGGGVQCALSTGTSFGMVDIIADTYSDPPGWGAEQKYWGTISYADINGDGKDDVCGRGGEGIICHLFTGTNFGPGSVWVDHYTDAQGFGSSFSYFATIMFPDINGDGKADICMRSGWGMECSFSTGTNFTKPTETGTEFPDASGWNDNYWLTLRPIKLASASSKGYGVCARGGLGIACSVQGPNAGLGWGKMWSLEFSDVAGWNKPEYHGTIRTPDVNGDGQGDICGRGVDGIICAIGQAW